ncbi:MAG: replication initiation protein [Pseudomonadota bacterium]
MLGKPVRTIDQQPSGEPWRADGIGTLVKPGELIDIVEMTPLTLNDRRIYNCLLANAWDNIGEDVKHVISKADLSSSHNGTERMGASIERLMAAIVRVRLPDGKLMRVQLLGSNTETQKGSGVFRYRFDSQLRKIIKNSSVFARIRSEVTFALSSKYALALYEMIQKRGNLSHRWSEEFSVDELRSLLGVEPGKLTLFGNFKSRALQPAVREVNALGDYGVQMLPVKTGRAVTAVKISWWRKSEDELKAAYQELQRSRVGRRARIAGTVEDVAAFQASVIK